MTKTPNLNDDDPFERLYRDVKKVDKGMSSLKLFLISLAIGFISGFCGMGLFIIDRYDIALDFFPSPGVVLKTIRYDENDDPTINVFTYTNIFDYEDYFFNQLQTTHDLCNMYDFDAVISHNPIKFTDPHAFPKTPFPFGYFTCERE
jgi:hypothetical protein